MFKRMLLLILMLFAVASYAQLKKSGQQASIIEAQYKTELHKKIKLNNYAVTDNQKKFDFYYYDINLDLDPSKQLLVGHVGFAAHVVDGPVSHVELDLLDNMTVDSVVSNGNKLSFSHDGDLLSIQLPGEMETGSTAKAVVYYRGRPARSGLGSFAFDNYGGKPMIWTLSEPFGARNWWPCKDAPIDKADSVDIKITVPAEMIAASNGNLISTTEANGKKTYWWHEGYPITTYLVSLAIYEYDVSYDWYVNAENDSMPLHFYSFPDVAQAVDPINKATKHMIAYFAETFGEYPFIDEKYGHAMFLWGGAMEHQTLSSMGAYFEDIVVHELAHQWFGDMITCEDFHHIWLNEGFATYCETLWFEFKDGIEGRKYARNQTRYYGPGTIYVEDTENDDIFSGQLSYNKASWVLHMLRFYMGDETFFEFLRTYYQRFQYSTINTEQFRDLAEEVSGLDLDTFFQQWIYEEGSPFYKYIWLSEEQPDGTYKVKLSVSQVQEYSTIFALPIDITIHTTSGDSVVRIFNDQKAQNYEFVLSEKPTKVILDEEEWLLRRVQPISTPVLNAQIVAVNDSSGNNNGEFEPGEEIKLVIEIANFGLPAESITGQLSTDDPDITITNPEVAFGNLGLGESISNQKSPYLLTASPGARSHIAKLVLQLATGDGYRETIKLNLNLGQANVLLVDDDAGEDYEQYVQQFAVDAGILTKTWTIAQAEGITLEELQRYEAVVWFTGDDRTTSLTADEQSLLTNYLNSGGRLLLSGQNIGYDLVEDGTPADTAFYSSVLHSRYVADSGSETMVIGNRQDTFFRTLVVYLEGQHGGARNQNSRDVIEPIEPAVMALSYIPSFDVAGIIYEDLATGSRLFYTSFGIEGIAGPTPLSASQFMDKALTWLLGHTTVEKKPAVFVPDDFTVLQNYPNPFNPTTEIRFSLPGIGHVEVTIYNTVGQVVKQLLTGQAEAGWHTVSWDGSNELNRQVASGLYVGTISYKTISGSQQVETIKMVKLQ